MLASTRSRALPVLVLVTLSVVLLAGCVDGSGDDSAENEDTFGTYAAAEGAEGHISYPGAAAHCEDAVAFFLRDPAHYQAQLPQNLTTRDAKDLADGFGLPVGSGKAAAYVSAYDCPTTDLAGGGPMQGGEVAILIEPPVLSEAHGLPEASLDFYLKNWHANGSAHLQRLATHGLPHTNATVDVAFSRLGDMHQGRLTIADAEGTLVSYRVDAPEADAYTGLVRIWHAVPNGTAYADLVFDAAPNGKGVVTDCAFRAGSVYAEVFGATDCERDPGLTLVFYDQSYDGGLHVLPGVRFVAG